MKRWEGEFQVEGTIKVKVPNQENPYFILRKWKPTVTISELWWPDM